MTVSPAFGRLILVMAALLFLNACGHFGEGNVDEERESHFLAGKSKKNSLDFKGAIESFEKAIEVNPRSAAAHLELGLLYEEKVNDYAAAIYHFEKHLKLKPTSNVAEMVRGQISNCKLELAKTIPFQLINSKVMVGIDKLNSENLALRQQVEELKARLTHVSALTNRPALSAVQSTHSPSSPNETPSINRSGTVTNRPSAQARGRSASPPVQTPPATRRTPERSSNAARVLRPHRVQSGETAESIARRYGITYQDILAANPGLKPRELTSGQTINVPVVPK